jgi:hypothetical protein
MKVTLQLPKSFLLYYPDKAEFIEMEARDGETVQDLIRRADLPLFEFGIVVVNGARELPSYHPKDGELLELLPIISGG